ncbi:hypothetical protein, partial [uncultured Nostoc sp.]|uniref:hypothetical protein n=1 Tax=uncultured Nostoc sp. TaxID=340711 RepID=UPI0035CBBA82
SFIEFGQLFIEFGRLLERRLLGAGDHSSRLFFIRPTRCLLTNQPKINMAIASHYFNSRTCATVKLVF